MRLAARVLLLVVAAASAAARAAAGEEPSADACLACHANALERENGPGLRAVAPEAFAASTHGDLGCVVCHADATAIPHGALAAVPLERCAVCHGDAVDAYRGSVHGAAGAAPAGAAPPSCDGCHGDVHALPAASRRPEGWERSAVATACAGCHAAGSASADGRLPVVRPVDAYLRSVHARAAADGRGGAVCSDCHGSHAIQGRAAAASPIARRNVPATCGSCHTGVLAAYADSVHGQALARGVDDAPACTDCHGEHAILDVADPASRVSARNLVRETCARCHADARLSAKYGLPTDNVASFESSFHGLALRGGTTTVANCASCHGVHDILPSSDPRSSIHPSRLGETCGACHPGAGTNGSLGPVHAAIGADGPTRWIRLVYVWLIAVVVGGMILHDAVDLGRKARTPLPPPPPAPPTPPRMPRALRWQHGLVMGSFPVLVYTGFALTYPEHWWATPMVHFEGTIPLRGLLHRTAAVAMMAALVWHAVHLAVSPELRACLRGALPSRNDVRVLRGTVAWWAGRRAHPPAAGPWHYAEKVEYWAFLWGAVLMSITGIALWFENATLRWLPGWVPAVATALHFYEAVLATLAILCWHLYWVVFDPVVYPMDWAWWSGRAPDARTWERLPPRDETSAEARPPAGDRASD